MTSPGRALNAAFYSRVVGPLLAPWPHAAALLGWGSDVLGYDTDQSRDHGWGPRLAVFCLSAADVPPARAALAGLPPSFEGLPVRYGWDREPVEHRVGVSTLPTFLRTELGAAPPLSVRDWLVVPQQKLLGVVAGPVYADPSSLLAPVRAALSWYPDEVWRWLMACRWHALAEEEAFVGRTAQVGDELGSRVLAARLAREAVRLSFLQERVYAPYSKWLGTAFAGLPSYGALGPLLSAAVDARAYPEREAALCGAYEMLARRHNALGLTPSVDPSVRRFHDRPFRVLDAGRFAGALLETVSDPYLRSLPLVGSADQLTDSVDLLSDAGARSRLLGVYDPPD